MTDSEFIEWLHDIETTLPVDSWRVDGLRIWPLMRLAIYAENFGAMVREYSQDAGVVSNVQSVVTGLGAWARAVLWDRRNNTCPDRPANAVFLGYSIGKQPLFEAKRYNSHVAPYIALLERTGLTCSVWEMCPYGQYNVPRYTPSHFVQPYLIGHRIAARVRPPKASDVDLQRFDELSRFAARANLHSRYVSLGALLRDVSYVRSLANRFKRWLRKSGATFAFMADYGPREYALCIACRELGIVSVDIQHGVQGDLHPAYGSWFTIPADGWEMRPNVFWCWDDASAAAINRWAIWCRGNHRAVAGGDPWREMWTDGSGEIVERYDAEIAAMKNAAAADTHILVTLGFHEDLFPDRLLDALSRSPASWCYWVRPHPVNQRRRLSQAASILRYAGVHHVDPRRVVEMPLFGILRHVDCHVTVNISSVILEAEDFGVPSVACGLAATEYYSEQIQRGSLSVALKTDEILDAVKSRLLNRSRVRGRPHPRPRDAILRLLTSIPVRA